MDKRMTLSDEERSRITRCLDNHGGVCREVMCDESLDEAVRRILVVRVQALRKEIAGQIEAEAHPFLALSDPDAHRAYLHAARIARGETR